MCQLGGTIHCIKSMVETLITMKQSCTNGIWWLRKGTKSQILGSSHSLNRTRKWGRTTHLGSSQHSTIQHDERGDRFFAKLVCEMSRIELKLAGFAFMDDTYLCLTQEPEHKAAITKRMQNAVEHWTGILWASGGVLVPEKCFWYKTSHGTMMCGIPI